MKIGVLTNSLVWAGMKDLEQIAHWAAANGLENLEVGPSVPMDEKAFSLVISEGKVDISAMIYCRNFLSEDEQESELHQNRLKSMIDFTSRLGIKKIVFSTGVKRDSFSGMRFDPEKSVDAVVEFLKGIVELAEKKNIRLCLENCPMMGNIAISPYMWEIIFDRVSSDKLGLAYDPSHMVWQFMDPYENIVKFKDKIFHLHGKDTEILYHNLARIGILHNITVEGSFFEHQWWRHRLPGLGDIDWNKIISRLYEIDYKGTISIEHEDPVWEGSLEKVQTGILKARSHIAGLF